VTQRPDPDGPGDSGDQPHDRPAGPGDQPQEPSTRARSGRARSRIGRSRRRPEVLDAGFTHRGGSGGTGFAAGGVLDAMPACGKLAVAADRAWARGLGALPDDELAGLMGAARRNASRAAALELAVIGELAARRAGPDGTPGEHVEDEVAALLTLTGRAAAAQVALAGDLGRLPAVTAGLAAGRIDQPKAQVFAGELIGVDDDLTAAAIAAALAVPAGGWTTGRLREEVRWLAAAFDPQAAAKRKAKAEKQARVEFWAEPSGTGAIAGRDLTLAAAIAADQQVDADARWLAARGAPGTLDRLRAGAFLARLSGQPIESLLTQLTATPAATPPGAPGSGPGPAGTGGNETGPAGTGGPVNPGGPGGSVNLTMPLATWLGHADTPGQDPRYGTLDAATCRDLTATLAGAGRARWCITLTDQHGRPAAHGCARAGPGPPGTDPAAWLATITITPVQTQTCDHNRQSASYQPSPTLRHLVKIRSPRCGYPGCRRPARRCDDDHTVPHHRGGRTCECNLHPLCRRHHRAKQAHGWHLTQPEPGVLAWTLPCGRTITTRPHTYPA
jgi:ribosomal protein L12E/L44/L45/RPP1/RPP2